MARIRTIKPEFPQSETIGKLSRDHRGHFKKAAIPAAVRREVCLRYGPKLIAEIEVKCHFCPALGGISWFYIEKGRVGWPAVRGLEFDHLEPESRGGPTTAENLVLACLPCNRGRGHSRQTPIRERR